ncbi:hypothetical protein [Paenibacillus abyssi]|uniref:Uncharacterized protein n=1 Tax=Paenibacillus abyssi TaxID=1340531 RepID=A0A917G292_9BACL|nr:hypothetical protein [Paenibacillus abyssi]GGG19297.1 hypothetical protein GCM10010916_40140 [Paenibacillus abyssi]
MMTCGGCSKADRCEAREEDRSCKGILDRLDRQPSEPIDGTSQIFVRKNKILNILTPSSNSTINS